MLSLFLLAGAIFLGSALIIFLPIVIWESHLPYSIPREVVKASENEPEQEVSEDD